jgi:hypothetical protein
MSTKLRRVVWIAGVVLAQLLLVAGAAAGALWLYLYPSFERTKGLVYGHRQGTPLTMDILRPPAGKRNGLGAAFLVSSG